MWSKLIRKPIFAVSTIVLLVGLGGFAIWQSAQQVPDWYDDAFQQSAEQNQTQGRQLERRLVSLSNDIRLGQQWSAVLPEQMINGWLASDLPEKFPDTLPDSIKDPRVKISDQTMDVAFQLNSAGWSGTLVLRLGIQSTDTPNQIAFQIHSVRSGLLPLPISWWAEPLTESLQKNDILLEWTEADGIPVALLTLPQHITTTSKRQSDLTHIQLQGNSIAVAGNTRHFNQTAELKPERR